MKNLSLLCLAAVLAAPVSAQTVEEAKTASDAALPAVSAPRLSDVCFGRGRLVAETRESIQKAEKEVAAKAMSVGAGVELVIRDAASDNGQCLAKTILAVMREEGQLASTISVKDSGRAISIFVSSAGGPVLFKGSSEAGSYALQVLTYRLQSLAQPAESSSGGCDGPHGGKDGDQMSCRPGFMRDMARQLDILRLLPDPAAAREAGGGKDADQRAGRERTSRE